MRSVLRRALEKKDLAAFLQDLREHFDLFAPLRLEEGISVYEKVCHAPEAVDLSTANVRKPLKEVFFPQSEVMFHYGRRGKRTEVFLPEAPQRERLCLGARPCDIQAVSMLDLIFAAEKPPDVYYLQRRNSTTIVGLGCQTPLTTCFCHAVGGGPFSREGSDAFMIDLGETYLVEILTSRGEALVRAPFLKEASPSLEREAQEVETKALQRLSSPPLALDGIDQKLEGMSESPLWERVEEKCVGCRVCTYLCPTCHCFDIRDEGGQSGGRRVRSWDSCLSALYTLETSGHNPRPTIRERVRQRLMHKFSFMTKSFGRIGCVGCGRCIQYCPTHFDIRQVLAEISQKDR